MKKKMKWIFECNRPTFFRIDRGLVSSRNVGTNASRNLINRSSSGWPSWMKNKDVTVAASFDSDSLPFRKDAINCSVKLSILKWIGRWIWRTEEENGKYRVETKSGRYFWENKAWRVRREFSRVFELKKFNWNSMN